MRTLLSRLSRNLSHSHIYIYIYISLYMCIYIYRVVVLIIIIYKQYTHIYTHVCIHETVSVHARGITHPSTSVCLCALPSLRISQICQATH